MHDLNSTELLQSKSKTFKVMLEIPFNLKWSMKFMKVISN